VLQTTAGKMIFGRFLEASAVQPAQPGAATSADSDPGRRPRPQSTPPAAAAGK
jgi:hypothetical protein